MSVTVPLLTMWCALCRKQGLFHADPHPGNVAVDTNGRLVFYDFGMMGEIVPDVKTQLLEVFYGVYEKDDARVLDALVRMEVVKAGGDRLALKRCAEAAYQYVQSPPSPVYFPHAAWSCAGAAA